MEIPEYILNPSIIGIQKLKYQSDVLQKQNFKSELFIDVNGSNISLEDYISKFESYSLEKFKLSELLPKCNIEENPNLIIKCLEKLIEFDLQKKYLSDYCYSQVLQRLIRIKEFENYAIEKALYLINYDRTELSNSKLYWLDLYQILYDYLSRKNWIELIEKNKVLVFNEYYGYQGISRISSLYARNKGFVAIINYSKLLSDWKNDLEKDATEFHWYKFSKYEYALYGIRSILEYNELSNNQVEYIRNLLVCNECHLMPGRIQDLVVICFYLTNKNNFNEDIEKYFQVHSESDRYLKLSNIKSFSEDTLLMDLNQLKLTTYKVGELWVETHLVSSFPLTDKAFWEAINTVIRFDTELGKKPVDYNDLIKKIISKLKMLPFIATKTISEKISEGYDYTIEMNTEGISYRIKPKDLGDYYDSSAVIDLINYILFDKGIEERLIPLEIDDQSAIYLIAKPNQLIDLYNKYELSLSIVNK